MARVGRPSRSRGTANGAVPRLRDAAPFPPMRRAHTTTSTLITDMDKQAAQLRAEEWARMPSEAKIVALLERVETLEADVRRLQEAANG